MKSTVAHEPRSARRNPLRSSSDRPTRRYMPRTTRRDPVHVNCDKPPADMHHELPAATHRMEDRTNQSSMCHEAPAATHRIGEALRPMPPTWVVEDNRISMIKITQKETAGISKMDAQVGGFKHSRHFFFPALWPNSRTQQCVRLDFIFFFSSRLGWPTKAYMLVSV